MDNANAIAIVKAEIVELGDCRNSRPGGWRGNHRKAFISVGSPDILSDLIFVYWRDALLLSLDTGEDEREM
jgi:hypothetical protein